MHLYHFETDVPRQIHINTFAKAHEMLCYDVQARIFQFSGIGMYIAEHRRKMQAVGREIRGDKQANFILGTLLLLLALHLRQIP